jgi:hypothetical protein
MHDDEYNFERMMIIGAIAVIIIIGLITSGNKSQTPGYTNGSYNTYTETHETNVNVNVCGICIDTRP